MNANNNLAVVNSVGVSTALSLQNAYVFICFNNPNDTKLSDAGEVNKNTQVKFQSGFMLYELSAYTAEQISDLAYVAGTDD